MALVVSPSLLPVSAGQGGKFSRPQFPHGTSHPRRGPGIQSENAEELLRQRGKQGVEKCTPLLKEPQTLPVLQPCRAADALQDESGWETWLPGTEEAETVQDQPHSDLAPLRPGNPGPLDLVTVRYQCHIVGVFRARMEGCATSPVNSELPSTGCV